VQVLSTPSVVDDSEAQTWAAAQQANSVGAYQAYLEAFPKGRYGVATRILMEEMRPLVAQRLVAPVQQAQAAINSRAQLLSLAPRP
jgi:hypothetical protein